jgi:hypothetical protein
MKRMEEDSWVLVVSMMNDSQNVRCETFSGVAVRWRKTSALW